MARKNYSEQFRRQAVDLYESTPGATLKGIAADLGVERATLKRWVGLCGTGKKTGTDGSTSTSSSSPARTSGNAQAGPARPESPAAKIARLEARVAELEASEKKLATEREILRSAAKYFAGETRW